MARAWISNPDYFDIVKEGRSEDLVPCLRCNKCHGRGDKDPFVSVCSVNPIIGLEHKIQRMVMPVKKKKKVAIVGGGPGGMRCALYLKERGHDVTIYEAGDELGGAIKHSDYASFKWPLRDFKNFLINQIAKHDIAVKMNTKATPEMLSKENYDVIITALGAIPAKPPISGIDNENVFFAEKAFMDPDSLGKNVVIIGGGEVGVEAAMHLCEKGHNATVLEMRDKLAADSTKIHYVEMFKEAWEALPNFSSIVNATVTSIKDGDVCYKDNEGLEHCIPCDSIVVSAGMKALTDEALKFAGISDEFYMIGDCKSPATIQQAMRSAFSTAMRI
jgi:NADPH-dependent 2,4-dienoyl-CoA reductase/sulfur reductase-like enzyme